MQNVLRGAVETVGDAMSTGGMTNESKKTKQLQKNICNQTDKDLMTSEFGVRQSNTDNWLSASSSDVKGPLLLEDSWAREKIMHFDHERIPERVVHARGTGAFGQFKLYESLEDLTYAPILTDTSRVTPTFVRFSTVLGSRGSADTVRDVRGFATKFYTDEGNWDLVGNNIPVFFIQDAMKFPDVIHAAKPEPDTEIPQAQTAHNNFWDFQFLHTEATHMFMWAMSDRAIPRSYRMMQGFGVNTFTLTNKQGVRHLVKFIWTPTLGIHSLVWDEALKLAGEDPDFHRRDLVDAIKMGAYPTYKFGVQVCKEEDQDKFDFDVLDATKVWPEDLFPIRYVGEMELNRNVDEFFTETEQIAFCTSHVVPGIGFSDDPLLQGRNFSYFDTQLSRLGKNWQEIPINRPVCPVMNFHRDGALRHTITPGKVNYWPNRFGVVKPASEPHEGGYQEYPEKIVGMKARLNSKKFGEHFNQAQLFWNSMSPIEKRHITKALAFELDHCDDPMVYERMCQRLCDIDLELAQMTARLVGGPTPEKAGRPNHGKTAPGLSQDDYTFHAMNKNPTIVGRIVAIMIADGFNYSEYSAVKAALTGAGAFVFTIGPRRQSIKPSGGTGREVKPEHHWEAMRSTAFDTLYIPGGEHVNVIRRTGRAMHWIKEAFGHCKAIGATGEAVNLVREAVGVEGMLFATGETSADAVDSYGVVTAGGVGEGVGQEGEGLIEKAKSALKMAKGAKNFVDAYAYNIACHRCFERELDGLTDLVAY